MTSVLLKMAVLLKDGTPTDLAPNASVAPTKMVSDVVDHARQLSKMLTLEVMQRLPSDMQTVCAELEEAIANLENITPSAQDVSGELFDVDSIVRCVNTELNGDVDSDDSFDLTLNKEYKVARIVWEENLLHPMISLEGSTSGPVFAQRFELVKGDQ
jgi:hypothetical protein